MIQQKEPGDLDLNYLMLYVAQVSKIKCHSPIINSSPGRTLYSTLSIKSHAKNEIVQRTYDLVHPGCMKYGDTIMVVGGEDDKSWMAGLFELKERGDGTEYWVEGKELPTVMSTFGCVVANISKELIRQDL